jgi:uncharacterized membrane protein
MIEARRYRFFDVYRARVRTLEHNWFAPIFLGEANPDRTWLEVLGNDLRQPAFLIGSDEAFSRRLRRNYGWIYLILLLAWLFKTTAANPESVTKDQMVHSFGAWLHNAAIGALPGALVAAAIAAFYAWLVFMACRRSEGGGDLTHGDVHV